MNEIVFHILYLFLESRFFGIKYIKQWLWSLLTSAQIIVKNDDSKKRAEVIFKSVFYNAQGILKNCNKDGQPSKQKVICRFFRNFLNDFDY